MYETARDGGSRNGEHLHCNIWTDVRRGKPMVRERENRVEITVSYGNSMDYTLNPCVGLNLHPHYTYPDRDIVTVDGTSLGTEFLLEQGVDCEYQCIRTVGTVTDEFY